jgi:hypothetical protein
VELGREHIKAFRQVLTDLVQAAATVADQCVRLDHFLNARQVLGQGTTVGIPRLGRAGFGRINGFIFSMDCGNCCLNIFQRQFKLFGIGLL